MASQLPAVYYDITIVACIVVDSWSSATFVVGSAQCDFEYSSVATGRFKRTPSLTIVRYIGAGGLGASVLKLPVVLDFRVKFKFGRVINLT